MSGNLIRFPTRMEASNPTPQKPVAPTPSKRVVMHDGALTLFQRDSVKGTWQYRLRLPDGTDERKSTGERNVEKATKIAEARLLEVRWREERGLSVKDITFETAAASYAKHRRREAKLNG